MGLGHGVGPFNLYNLAEKKLLGRRPLRQEQKRQEGKFAPIALRFPSAILREGGLEWRYEGGP